MTSDNNNSRNNNTVQGCKSGAFCRVRSTWRASYSALWWKSSERQESLRNLKWKDGERKGKDVEPTIGFEPMTF